MKSDEMFKKELWMSLVGYNLATQFRREAAAAAKVSPRKLSFTGVLATFNTLLLKTKFTTAAQWRSGYQEALHYAMPMKLPNWPNRSYEREAYHQRPKSAQFKKHIPKSAAREPEK